MNGSLRWYFGIRQSHVLIHFQKLLAAVPMTNGIQHKFSSIPISNRSILRNDWDVFQVFSSCCHRDTLGCRTFSLLLFRIHHSFLRDACLRDLTDSRDLDVGPFFIPIPYTPPYRCDARLSQYRRDTCLRDLTDSRQSSYFLFESPRDAAAIRQRKMIEGYRLN